MPNEDLIRPSGDYKQLISYQKTDVIFRITYYFCHNFLTKGDRTIDQMLQAARSGKQNIIEGCAAYSTSSKTEIKLLNVAKASLKELLEDFEDYLKTRDHQQWIKGSPEYDTMRRLGKEKSDPEYYMNLVRTRPPETVANIAIVLINQADYLLHRQIKAVSDMFLNEGGFQERMYNLRQKKKRNQ